MATITLNQETIMRLYTEAKRRAGAVDRSIETWVTIVNEFIRQQDAALRDTRDALREAMVRAATDQAEIQRLTNELRSAECVIRQVAADTFGEEMTVKEFADRSSYDS